MARAPPAAWLKPAVIAGGLLPAAVLLARALTGKLGANPIATALNQLGLLALLLLVGGLALTPLRLLFGWTWPARIRRAVGLLAFFYASLHVLTYVAVDQELVLGALVADVRERPFILVGLAAWLTLVPLALTSTDAMVRRLKFARWQRLHRLAYLAAALGVTHFWMRVKKDLTEPAVYAALLVGLLAVRLARAGRKRSV